MKKQNKPLENWKNKRIMYLDPIHGFWKMGVCYKETDKWLSVHDVNGKHRRRIPNSPDNVTLFKEEAESNTTVK